MLRYCQFTFLNLVGLSTGLASAILIYLWVSDEMSVDKFNEKGSRLFKVMYNIQTANEFDAIKAAMANPLRVDEPNKI